MRESAYKKALLQHKIKSSIAKDFAIKIGLLLSKPKEELIESENLKISNK
jgi:hypothetical protein